MKVTVKLVVFEHPNPAEWDIYCSYCPELKDCFGRGNTVQDCVNWVQQNLIEQLQNRLAYKNLQIYGWTVSENSANPPIFTEEEAVKMTARLYEVDITRYQYLELYAELPPPKKLW